jgi:hypothetical protein
MNQRHRLNLNTPLLFLFLGFLCLWLCIRIPTVVMGAAPTAQDPPQQGPSAAATPKPDLTITELDKRLNELEKRATIATKEKEIAVSEAERATAEKNKILNLLPTPTATPLAGTTTVDAQVVFQSELMAYKSLSDVAGFVGDDLQDVNGSVVIYNEADMNALQTYSILLAQIKTTVDQYKALNQRLNPGSSEEVGPAAIFAAPQVASTLLKSVADIAALFRTNTTITGTSVSVDDAVLNSQVADTLRRKGFRVFEPKLFLPNLFDQPDSEIIKQLGNLNLVKARGEQAVAEFDALSAEAQKASVKKAIISRVRALNTQVDTFINNLMRIDETTRQSPLTGLYRAERLRNLLGDEKNQTYVLHLKVAKAEGTKTIKSNLFTGTKLTYAGGMIVSYTLFDRNGQIVKSGIRGSLRGSSNSRLNNDLLLKLP